MQKIPTNDTKLSSTTNLSVASQLNEQPSIETTCSDEPFAKKTLLNHDNNPIISFINYYVESGAYQILLKLRHVDRYLCSIVDYLLSSNIQNQYIPSQDQCNFKILEHPDLRQAPVCFKSALEQTLVSYFHSLSQLQFNPDDPDNIAHKRFVEIFKSRLDSLEKLCTNNNFRFNFFRSHQPIVALRFLNPNNPNQYFDYLRLNLDSPSCAYLFSRIFNRFITDRKFLYFIAKLQQIEFHCILTFLQLYKSYDFISEIIYSFILALTIAIKSKGPQLRSNSMTLLQEAIKRNLVNMPHLKNFNLDFRLVRKLTKIIVHRNNCEKEVEAFRLFRLLFEHDLIDKSSVEELELEFSLTELLVDRLSHPEVIVESRVNAFFLFSALTQKGLIEKQYVLGEPLVRRLSDYIGRISHSNPKNMENEKNFITFHEQFFEKDSKLKSIWLAKVENNEIQWDKVIKNYEHICILCTLIPKGTLADFFERISQATNLEDQFRKQTVQLASGGRVFI
ncbi:MAG: hypothetical protein C5B43_04210 [Verrucomicrobia bacterium]|nr:MAG: hypothetical protein C5B43_04210 [Verrucomicrobiota bacterium]